MLAEAFQHDQFFLAYHLAVEIDKADLVETGFRCDGVALFEVPKE